MQGYKKYKPLFVALCFLFRPNSSTSNVNRSWRSLTPLFPDCFRYNPDIKSHYRETGPNGFL